MKFIRYFLFLLIPISIININKDLQSIDPNIDKILGISGMISTGIFAGRNLKRILTEFYHYKNLPEDEFYKCSHGSLFSKKNLLWKIKCRLFNFFPLAAFGINSHFLLKDPGSFKKKLGACLSIGNLALYFIGFYLFLKTYDHMEKNNLNEIHGDGVVITKDCILSEFKDNVLSSFNGFLGAIISYRLLKNNV